MSNNKNNTRHTTLTLEDLHTYLPRIQDEIKTFTTNLSHELQGTPTPEEFEAAVEGILITASQYTKAAPLLKIYILSRLGIAYLINFVTPPNFVDLEHFSEDDFFTYLLDNYEELFDCYLEEFMSAQ